MASIVSWDIAYTDLDAALVNWQMYGGKIEALGNFVDTLIEYVPYVLGLGIAMQLIGGIFVFIGFKPRLGALLLMAYLIFNTLLFFPFWFYEGTQLSLNFVLFMKNVSILGGLMLVFSSKGSSYRSYEMMDDDI